MDDNEAEDTDSFCNTVRIAFWIAMATFLLNQVNFLYINNLGILIPSPLFMYFAVLLCIAFTGFIIHRYLLEEGLYIQDIKFNQDFCITGFLVLFSVALLGSIYIPAFAKIITILSTKTIEQPVNLIKNNHVVRGRESFL